jgi:hypothetical protein
MLESLLTFFIYICVFGVFAYFVLLLAISFISVVGWGIAVVWCVVEEIWITATGWLRTRT